MKASEEKEKKPAAAWFAGIEGCDPAEGYKSQRRHFRRLDLVPDGYSWGILAREIARGRTVTVTVNKMIFKVPLHVGDPIAIYAELLKVGNSSMDIRLEVWAKPFPGVYVPQIHLVTEGIFRYVAVDDQGRPRKVPDNSEFLPKSSNSEVE